MNKIIQRLKAVGPAALVAAAFIGPGTVTTCTIAGAGFGYSLLWALVFSILATLVLQEMSARLGLIGQVGLGEAMRNEFKHAAGRILSIVIVIVAIAIGNAAYETGNIVGGAMGLEEISGIGSIKIGNFSFLFWGPVIGLIAFCLLISASYRVIEKGLIVLVILMSITFISTAIIVKPDPLNIAKGLLPSLPEGSVLTIMGLIGTTVVPYNLFLHASAVKQRWKDPGKLSLVRSDSIISIGAGGLISIAIVITSAAAFFGTSGIVSNAADIAQQLTPLLGRTSGIFLSLGLLSAGVSSAITAPLAAAYASSEILGWKADMKSPKFRAVWISVLLTGIIFSAIGLKPVKAIFVAQITNGILLPFIAFFLLRVMNNKSLLKSNSNGPIANILGVLVLLVATALGIKSIISVLGMI
ncbi:MAG: Nramp family divalent metal transporter [Marinilabiliaceae bacterium]|nr:Nramp family divalent metal transporter [Marinilabiliaceae bacterium]